MLKRTDTRILVVDVWPYDDWLSELMNTEAGGFEGDRTPGLNVSQTDGTPLLDLPTHAFKFLNESSDFLEHALLFCQVLRIKRAHLGQNGIELNTIVTGKFPF